MEHKLLDKKATFQHIHNPDQTLRVNIKMRETANVSGVFYAWDYISTIEVLSGESPLDGLSFPITGDRAAVYTEIVQLIMKKPPEYLFVSE
jgi:hypothetical protein